MRTVAWLAQPETNTGARKAAASIPERMRMKDLATRMTVSPPSRCGERRRDAMRCGRGLQTSKRSDKLSLILNTRGGVMLQLDSHQSTQAGQVKKWHMTLRRK